MPHFHSRRFPRLVLAVLTVASGGFIGAAEPTVRRVDPAAGRARAMATEVSAARANVVKPPADPGAPAGRFVVDARKISGLPAGTPSRASARVVATDLAGRPVSVRELGGGEASVAASPGQWVILKPEVTPVLRMQKGLQWLTSVCVPPNEQAGLPPQDTLGSYTDFETVPVTWDTAEDAYLMRARIGVAKNGDPRIGGPIGKTAEVRLSFIGVSGAEGVDCAIEQLGLGGEQEVRLAFDSTTTPEPRLVVRSTIAAEQPIALEVLPRVDVRPRRNPILGFGLEETTVVVECVQPNGAAFPLEESTPVDITCVGGREAGAERLVISGTERQARFQFRSVGLGRARILATTRTSSEAIVGSASVNQVLPWPQIFGAVLGGAMGGYARRFVKGARRKAASRRVAEGVVVGMVAFVAGVLGVGYLGLPAVVVATVAGAFLTGALTGFAGVTVFDSLTKKNVVTAA